MGRSCNWDRQLLKKSQFDTNDNPDSDYLEILFKIDFSFIINLSIIILRYPIEMAEI